MNVAVAVIVLVVVSAITVSAMLLVRTRAPEGSYFSDGDRASGVFGVLATGFSVLLAFIIFLAFESYDASRSGAETEATIVAQQIATAQFLPERTATELAGELVCYARSVAGSEWDRLEDGTLGDAINPWGAEMFGTLQSFVPQSDTEQSAYDRWLEQTSDREQARIDRIHGAEGIIPTPLWLVLYLIAAVIFVYMLFFADSAERAATQGLLMGSVTVVVTFSLLLLNFFDDPYSDGLGQLEPTAMERTLRVIEEELSVVALDLDLTPPCDDDGLAS
jgi:hypothetical protein